MLDHIERLRTFQGLARPNGIGHQIHVGRAILDKHGDKDPKHWEAGQCRVTG